MAWKVTANPDQYDEALAWFQNRVPMLKKDWLALDEEARRRAFTLAGVARVSIVQDVLDALEAAVRDGETLDDFRAKVGAKLAAEWGRPNARRVELIFRNGVQHAYNAGRYTLATHPDVLKARPYWMFDAILDQKTSDVCRMSDGAVLPADHPFWATHYPPLHHFCRSSVRNITTAEAAERGLTEQPPEMKASDGFGKFPKLSEQYKPDANAFAETLKDVLEAALVPPPLTGAQVRDRLAQLDTDTSLQVKALETSKAEAKARFDSYRTGQENSFIDAEGKRRLDKWPGGLEEWMAERDSARDKWISLGERIRALRDKRAADALDILKADKPLSNLDIAMKSNTKAGLKRATKEKWQKGLDAFQNLVGEQPGLALPNGGRHFITFERLPPTGRAQYSFTKKTAYLTDDTPASVIAHELAHWLEFTMKDALEASKAFYARRTEGESFERLASLHPRSGYKLDEITKKDHFFDDYVGKYYEWKGEQVFTELVTMGIQAMLEEPFAFAKVDPDHFDFVWHLIRGLPYK